MNTAQENSIMLHINERLFSKGLINEILYNYAKTVIIRRK